MTARTIAQSAVSAVSIYMRQVYMWMTAGLAITAVTAFAVASSPDLQMAILGNMAIVIALIVAQFGLVIALSAAVHKMSATTATAVFIAYSALTGLTLSSIFVVYPIGSIANAFLTATGTFLAMSVYGTVTRRDLTGMGNFPDHGPVRHHHRVHRQHLPGQQHDGLRHQLHRRADLHRPYRL